MLQEQVTKTRQLLGRIDNMLTNLYEIKRDMEAVYSFHTNWGVTLTDEEESRKAYEQDKVLEEALDALGEIINNIEKTVDSVEAVI